MMYFVVKGREDNCREGVHVCAHSCANVSTHGTCLVKCAWCSVKDMLFLFSGLSVSRWGGAVFAFARATHDRHGKLFISLELVKFPAHRSE